MQLLGAAQVRIGGLGELGEVGEVRPAGQLRFPGLLEPLRGVLLDRVEHPVARRAVAGGDQQRLLGQRGEQLEHLVRLDAVPAQTRSAASGSRRRRTPRAGAAPSARRRRAAPSSSRPPRATSCAAATPSGPRRSAGGTGHRAGRRADRRSWCATWPRPARSPAASRPAPGRCAPSSPGCARRPRDPCAPRPPGPAATGRLARTRSRRAGVPWRQGQRLDRPQRLTGDAERFPAGRQDPQPPALPEQPVGERRRRLDHVLAVVQDQQRLPVARSRR